MSKIKSYHDTVYDSETGVPVVFTKEEYATRQGNFYHAHIDTGALGDGDSAELYFKSPASSVTCYMICGGNLELAGALYMFRSSTVSLSGTVVTVFNDDHRSANSSTIAVRSSPTLTDSGTKFDHILIGGGKRGNTGGDAKGAFVPKADTIYTVRITSLAASNSGDIRIEWGENPNAN